jgi:hypothetical protein
MGMRLYPVAGLAALFACLVLAASATAVPARYCEYSRPSGAYLEATYNVGCGKARRVENAMFSARCIHKKRCSALGFTCFSYWNYSYNHPFSFSHHGICRARIAGTSSLTPAEI